MRRDREEVLGEPVVDLARDARPLVGDGAPELGGADRAPDADEQDAVREQAQEVALRDVVAREQRREDVVQLREERERRGEREPAVEVLAVLPVAEPEADQREQARAAPGSRARSSASGGASAAVGAERGQGRTQCHRQKSQIAQDEQRTPIERVRHRARGAR